MKGWKPAGRIAVFALFLFSSVIAAASPPRAGREGLIHVNGTDLFYEVIGNGTPLVVVHGGPGLDHTYFLPQMARLADHYKLIFYDQRASGESSINVDSSSMTMENFVDDLEGIRKAFHLGKMNLLAHSWGGLLAMFYAVKYPDHLKSLILVDPTPASSELQAKSFEIMEQRTTKADNIKMDSIMHTRGFRVRAPATMDQFFRVVFRPMFYNPNYSDSLTLTLDSNYAKQSKLYSYMYSDSSLMTFDLFEKLGVISCPTLIIAGDHDIIPPDADGQLHESIHDSEYKVIKDCGHFPFIEAPNRFFNLVEEFLRKASR